ncbi:MAG: response regulator, partial [Actinobacteria bacterium]|nr:response regulator [Actinomycetota bacterium]
VFSCIMRSCFDRSNLSGGAGRARSRNQRPNLSQRRRPTVAERILVVEDEYLSRTAMSKYLSGKGYDVRQAANGAEALEILTGETFNLVITDFVMPHVDGLRLIELIHAKWARLPVILMTGYLSARAGNTILEGMVAEVITKPIALPELLKNIKRILKSFSRF